MKKAISFVLAVALMAGCFCISGFAAGKKELVKDAIYVEFNYFVMVLDGAYHPTDTSGKMTFEYMSGETITPAPVESAGKLESNTYCVVEPDGQNGLKDTIVIVYPTLSVPEDRFKTITVSEGAFELNGEANAAYTLEAEEECFDYWENGVASEILDRHGNVTEQEIAYPGCKVTSTFIYPFEGMDSLFEVEVTDKDGNVIEATKEAVENGVRISFELGNDCQESTVLTFCGVCIASVDFFYQSKKEAKQIALKQAFEEMIGSFEATVAFPLMLLVFPLLGPLGVLAPVMMLMPFVTVPHFFDVLFNF